MLLQWYTWIGRTYGCCKLLNKTLNEMAIFFEIFDNKLVFFLQIESGELKLSFPVMIDPSTFGVHIFPIYFGGTVLSDEQTIVSVPSMNLVYFVAVDTKRQVEKWASFDLHFSINTLHIISILGEMNGKKNSYGLQVKPKTLECLNTLLLRDLLHVHLIMS